MPQQSTSINILKTNKLDEDLSLMPQRVPATPIIRGTIPVDVSTGTVHDGLTLRMDTEMSLEAIRKQQTTKMTNCEHISVIEGQTKTLVIIITITTF